jgi:hypothetical protein
MNSYQAYVLRMQLIATGYIPIPCKDGKPAFGFWGFPSVAPSEGAVRRWSAESDAYDTGIEIDGRLVIVTEVPKTPAQMQADAIAEEKRRQEALIEAGRARERQRKEEKRRAEGEPTRAEWLAARGARPWEAAGMSRMTWYRHRKKQAGD